MTSTPTELLQRIAARDRVAFRELYDSMGPQVKGYLVRACGEASLAEELTQEVMLVVWNNAAHFDPGRARAETWIYAIARNRVIDQVRRRRVVEANERDPHFVPEPLEAVDAAMVARQRDAWLAEAVGRLSDPQRELVEQAFYQAKSYPEIAREEGVALGTIKSRARLAFAKLRALLDRDGRS